MRSRILFPAVLFSLSACACGEDLSTTTIKTERGIAVLPLKPLYQFDWSARDSVSHTGFLRSVTTESFGYSLAPTAAGFEFSSGLTPGPFEAHGLECPTCTIQPMVQRSRYTLPAFGALSTLELRNGRAQLFAGFGGVNTWKPDNFVQMTGKGTWSSSFSDAWLAQVVAGGKVAVDHDRRIWLGVAGRYFENFAPIGKKRWVSATGTATFRFGH